MKNENGEDNKETSGFPTPEEVISLAWSVGYEERRPSVSSTLFFKETNPEHDMPACLINIYYTTRSIMTHLNHSATGTNELWRSNAYNDLEELRVFFLNPRIHTGKGYRNAQKAVRGCVGCGEMKTRAEFSKNQWTIKGPDANKCLECVNAAKPDLGAWSSLTSGLENVKLEDDTGKGSTFLSLTEDALKIHDKKASTGVITEGLVRRQFNCPDCPRLGRGEFVFFKKVPAHKPIVKCPQCKKKSRGKCDRLYPVPKEAEKGYGLYKCGQCGDKWGSSRAVNGIGQECYSCVKKGVKSALVTPFRLENPRKKKNDGRGMKRVPKEPIVEDEPVDRGYGDADRQRNNTSWENSGVGGAEGAMSYDFQPRGGELFGGEKRERVVPLIISRIPSGYKHKCAGCASGSCKNRKIPYSEMHDTSDGNTVSTRASVVTNSSIDKSDFIDRDDDFSAFDSDSDSDGGSWIEV